MKDPNPSDEPKQRSESGYTRREFVSQVAFGSAGVVAGASLITASAQSVTERSADLKRDNVQSIEVSLNVNEQRHTLQIDPRMTLLDALREKLALFGTKKGCDHGQCGACTVIYNGKRINSCLTLAVMCNEAIVTTVEGLAKKDQLHPMQTAFIKHDAFQCGYCTPGQLCSAVALLSEGHARTTGEIRELMSGNICRCGAYQNIIDAIREVGAIH